MNAVNRFRNGKSVYLLDVALIVAVLFTLRYQPQRLQEYELICRNTADSLAKEEIARAAVDFLLRQPLPDSISRPINQLVAKEELRLPAGTFLFSTMPAVLTDSLLGLYDDSLTVFLPKLFWMQRHRPDSVRHEQFLTAGLMAARVDSGLTCSYWMPLLEFLDKADTATWHKWRTAVKASELSRAAYKQSQFECAKFLALAGLHNAAAMPDRRLYLDLCLRLQNALVEGAEPVFNIGFAFADWVARESRELGYFLRLVSAEFNCGNQLYQFGRYDEALERFKTVLKLTQQWRHFPRGHMQWYSVEAMERLAAVFYKLGDYSAMRNHLESYGKLVSETRQKTLYHLDRGMGARLIGDLQAAEDELRTAIKYGKGEAESEDTDPVNAWYAYLELGDLYLEYDLPEKALFTFRRAKTYATQNKPELLAGEKLNDYWLHMAEAFAQSRILDSAAIALKQANRQPVDSPWLQVKNFFCAAKVNDELGKVGEADTLLSRALALCQNNGMTIYAIDAILRRVALSFKVHPQSAPAQYSMPALEALIAQVKKSGAKQQLVHSLALAVEAANRAGRYEQARPYADRLLQEIEALSRLYDQEQRQVFFQHSTYDKVKAAVDLDIRLGKIDSAFIKLDYIKFRALRQRLAALQDSRATTATHSAYMIRNSLQQHLQPDEAIINYMVTADTLYAFVLTSSRLRLFRTAVPRRDLQNLVHQYIADLAPTGAKSDGYDEQRQQREFLNALQLSHSLYNHLVKPMAEYLATSKFFYIVPDEFLHSLPFNTLAFQEEPTTEFLIDRKAVMYLPAASVFFTAGENRDSKLPRRLLASVDSTMHGARKILEALSKLRTTKVTRKTNWESPAQIATGLFGDYQIYFFYAHAEANWDDPWQSFIQMPLQPSLPQGKLTYSRIDSIDWRQAALVILAGCETTGNRVYHGAGLSGLQRSFFGAGAKQVLATFWKVDAEQVAQQMPVFLQEWDRSGDAILALQKMQQTAIVHLRNDPYINYPHPRYWGAYNLTGTKTAAQVPAVVASSVR